MGPTFLRGADHTDHATAQTILCLRRSRSTPVRRTAPAGVAALVGVLRRFR